MNLPAEQQSPSLVNELDYSIPAFVSKEEWHVERPHILVIACSDGRYQRCLDEFMVQKLGITDYDRLYAPGGPGALASSSLSYFRGDQFRQEAAFLIEVHAIQEIILIFHGPVVSEGPVEATCADYSRKFPDARGEEIPDRMQVDLNEVMKSLQQMKEDLRVRMFRAEVKSDHRVQFVPLSTI